MWIELCERLFGYDKWTETTARFEAANVQQYVQRSTLAPDQVSYSSRDTIVWTDADGKEHRASFVVGENSPVYYQYDGSQVPIRYNPANPDRFYYRDLFLSRVRSRTVATLTAIGILALYYFRYHQSPHK